MDYADGGDLGDKIKAGKASGKLYPEQEILNWFT